MVDYREILRLDNLGCTKKDIASSVHSSRNTISEVLTLASNLHVCWPLDDDVTNPVLENLFYPGRNKANEERLMPDYPKIHKELAKKGVTLTLLWTEYCLEASAVCSSASMQPLCICRNLPKHEGGYLYQLSCTCLYVLRWFHTIVNPG